MSQDKQSAIEAAARALMPPVSSGNLQMDLRSAARRCVAAYLNALVEDERAVEAIGKAMLADELSARPRRDFDATWADEDLIWLSNARAAMRTLATRAQGESS